MPNLVHVESRALYRIYVEYDDGERGEVDYSHKVGRGVFKVWDKPGVFEQVYLTEYGAIAWSDELDLCPNATYFRLTGKKPEEMMPGLRDWPGEGIVDPLGRGDGREGE